VPTARLPTSGSKPDVQSEVFDVGDEGSRFRLVFSPDAQAPGGYADIGRFAGTGGLSIFIR